MSKSVSKRIQHWIEYFFTRGMMLFIWLVPLPAAYRFAEALGWLAFFILRIRRSVVMQNLTRAFPEKSVKEKKRMLNITKYAIIPK